MPEMQQTAVKIKNKKQFWSIDPIAMGDTINKIGCLGTSTSKDEFSGSEFAKILELVNILGLKKLYSFIPGIFNRFNLAIKASCNREQIIELAKGPFHSQLFIKESLEFEENWLTENLAIIEKFKLNFISPSMLIFNNREHKRLHNEYKELLEDFPIQKKIFEASSDQTAQFFNKFNNNLKVIVDYYHYGINQKPKKNTPLEPTNLSTEPLMDPVIKRATELVNFILSSNSQDNPIKQGIDQGAKKYLEQKYRDYIEQVKKQKSTNNATALTEQEIMDIQISAQKLYKTDEAFVCAVLYLLEELTFFYIFAKKLRVTHYFYPDKLENLPADTVFQKYIANLISQKEELFKYVSLLKVDQKYRKQLEDITKSMQNSSNSRQNNLFPASRSYPPDNPKHLLDHEMDKMAEIAVENYMEYRKHIERHIYQKNLTGVPVEAVIQVTLNLEQKTSSLVKNGVFAQKSSHDETAIETNPSFSEKNESTDVEYNSCARCIIL